MSAEPSILSRSSYVRGGLGVCAVVVVVCLACGCSSTTTRIPDTSPDDAATSQDGGALGSGDAGNPRPADGATGETDSGPGGNDDDANPCADAVCGDVACTQGCETFESCPTDCGPLVYANGDARRIGSTSTGDWSTGNNKAECGRHQALTGLSVDTGAPYGTHAALCGADDAAHYGHDGCNPLFFGSSDNRADTSTGDWDPDATKGECGAGSYVAGVAENEETVVTILCCPGVHLKKTNCTPAVFWQSGAREPGTLSADWDPGYNEGECGPGRYVAGVSHTGPLGANQGTRAILCCRP